MACGKRDVGSFTAVFILPYGNPDPVTLIPRHAILTAIRSAIGATARPDI
jgi:hypothetical protein